MTIELSSYLEILKDVKSPLFLTLLFSIFLGGAIFLIFTKIIIPKNRSHKIEKEALLSLFARLDPDPLIRFNRQGSVIISNDSASNIFRSSFKGIKIQQLFRNVTVNPSELIDKDLTFSFKEKIQNKYFLITVKPVPTMGAGQLYFKDISDSVESEKKFLEYQKRLIDYSENLQSHLEDEKYRIAEDLHDSIGQRLLLLKMKLQKYIDSDSPAEKELNASLEETIAELREIIYNLKPKILEELGLPAAINSLLQKIFQDSGIKGTFELLGNTDRFESKTELFLFRIAQEAVNNIVKHSEASLYNIQLINSASHIKLIISDNGKGFNADPLFNSSSDLKGFGLFNIKEKVEKYSGSLRVNSFPGEGTILLIQLCKKV